MEAAGSSEMSVNFYRHTQRTAIFKFKSYSTEKGTLPKNVNHEREVEFNLNFEIEIDVKPCVGNTLVCRIGGVSEHHGIMLTYFVLG
jgi:hypothetical protein